jgi:hypothetical protein
MAAAVCGNPAFFGPEQIGPSDAVGSWRSTSVGDEAGRGGRRHLAFFRDASREGAADPAALRTLLPPTAARYDIRVVVDASSTRAGVGCALIRRRHRHRLARTDGPVG